MKKTIYSLILCAFIAQLLGVAIGYMAMPVDDSGLIQVAIVNGKNESYVFMSLEEIEIMLASLRKSSVYEKVSWRDTKRNFEIKEHFLAFGSGKTVWVSYWLPKRNGGSE